MSVCVWECREVELGMHHHVFDNKTASPNLVPLSVLLKWAVVVTVFVKINLHLSHLHILLNNFRRLVCKFANVSLQIVFKNSWNLCGKFCWLSIVWLDWTVTASDVRQWIWVLSLIFTLLLLSLRFLRTIICHNPLSHIYFAVI